MDKINVGKKTLLVLGCSQSSGAEISHANTPDYWDSILSLDNPLTQWYDVANSSLRMKKFYEEVPKYENDYICDYSKAWPGLIASKIKDLNVISAARSGSGIDWVKFMYNLKFYYYFNTDTTKQSIAKKLSKNKLTEHSLFWPLEPNHEVKRYESLIKQLYPSLRHEGESVFTNFHILKEYYRNWMNTDYTYSGKDFDVLIDEADILVWQLTNEPRLNITDPCHDVAYPTPSISANIDHYLYNINTIIDRHFNDAEENIEMKKYWKNEVNNLIEHYISRFDYSDHTTNIITFFNSVLRKRKMLGKTNIIVTIDERQLKPYCFGDRIDYTCVDDFVNIKDIPEMSMGASGDSIKNRILNGTWPYMKFMHYSAYGNEMISEKIMKSLNKFI